jgi:hypothetical protein
MLLAIGALSSSANADGIRVPDYARGNFKSSGHVCYGMLTITSRLITWTTQSNFCRSSPYIVSDLQEWRSGTRITFLLRQPSSKCFFPVLVVTHDGSLDMGIGWNVAGYPSLENAKRDEMEGALDCWLYRY